ncbi:MAG: hypothetical protein R3321_01615 [Nitrososphaeraceae archaeon]|nr:hypothetical protein [Nitrososphaeraceae archaeon]
MLKERLFKGQRNEKIGDIPYLAVYSHCHTTFNANVLNSLIRMDSAYFYIVYDSPSQLTGELYQVWPYYDLDKAKEDNRTLFILKLNTDAGNSSAYMRIN